MNHIDSYPSKLHQLFVILIDLGYGRYCLGWLPAPLISLLLDFCGFSLFRGTPILAGGIGVARAVVGAFCAVCFLFFEQL